jgi:hypothetical protein
MALASFTGFRSGVADHERGARWLLSMSRKDQAKQREQI